MRSLILALILGCGSLIAAPVYVSATFTVTNSSETLIHVGDVFQVNLAYEDTVQDVSIPTNLGTFSSAPVYFANLSQIGGTGTWNTGAVSFSTSSSGIYTSDGTTLTFSLFSANGQPALAGSTFGRLVVNVALVGGVNDTGPAQTLAQQIGIPVWNSFPNHVQFNSDNASNVVSFQLTSFEATATPEPATGIVAGVALAAIVTGVRRRAR